MVEQPQDPSIDVIDEGLCPICRHRISFGRDECERCGAVVFEAFGTAPGRRVHSQVPMIDLRRFGKRVNLILMFLGMGCGLLLMIQSSWELLFELPGMPWYRVISKVGILLAYPVIIWTVANRIWKKL